MFIICTTLVLIFKKEVDNANDPNGGGVVVDDLSLIETYKTLFDIIRLRPVLTLIFVHMTAKVSPKENDAAASSGLTSL